MNIPNQLQYNGLNFPSRHHHHHHQKVRSYFSRSDLLIHRVDGDGEGGVVPFHLLFVVDSSIPAMTLGILDPRDSHGCQKGYESDADDTDNDDACCYGSGKKAIDQEMEK